MEATLLLCDFAEEVGGKLYIMGGGWTRIVADQPVPMALAVKLEVPWDQANRKHSIKFLLLTEDGEPVMSGENKPIEVSGVVEAGRPAGIKAGSDLTVALAIKINGITLTPGGYLWDFSVNDRPIKQVSFLAVEGGV